MKRRLVCCLICLVSAVLPAAAVLASGGGTNITATVPLVISNVSVSGITAGSAVITWQTNGAANSQVEYGADISYGLIASQPTDSTSSHSVTLNNLNQAATYHFRAKSTVDGLTAVSPDNTFVTLAGTGGGETTTTTTSTTTTTTTTTTTSTTPTTTTGTSATNTTTSPGSTQTAWTPTATGVTPATITLASADSKNSVTIPKGTLALDKNGAPLQAITCSPPASAPPPAPTSDTLVAALELGPSGATFSTPVTVAMQYDPATLPSGAGEGDLIIAFYNTTAGAWVPLGNIVIDTVHHTISCTTTHFTEFAVFYAPVTTATTATQTTTTATTAAGPVVSFVNFSVTPQYDSTTNKLTSAAVNYLVRNSAQPLSQVELVLKVSLDNAPLEDVPVQSLAQLPSGDTSGSLEYVPAQGWQSGTYIFRIEMAAGGELFTTSPEEQVTVPPVASVRLVLISEIFGAAIFVIAAVLLLILIRRRRALK